MNDDNLHPPALCPHWYIGTKVTSEQLTKKDKEDMLVMWDLIEAPDEVNPSLIEKCDLENGEVSIEVPVPASSGEARLPVIPNSAYTRILAIDEDVFRALDSIQRDALAEEFRLFLHAVHKYYRPNDGEGDRRKDSNRRTLTVGPSTNSDSVTASISGQPALKKRKTGPAPLRLSTSRLRGCVAVSRFLWKRVFGWFYLGRGVYANPQGVEFKQTSNAI